MHFSKLSRQERLLFLTPLLLLVVPLWSVIGNRADKLERAQREIAGAEAVNCGIGHWRSGKFGILSEDYAKVDGCTVVTFKAKKPFYARFEEMVTTDTSYHSTGIAGTAEGKIFLFFYIDGSHFLQKAYVFQQEECKKPKIVSAEGNGSLHWQRIGCELAITP